MQHLDHLEKAFSSTLWEWGTSRPREAEDVFCSLGDEVLSV